MVVILVVIILLTVGTALAAVMSIVGPIAIPWKRNSNEKEIVKAIIDTINNGDWSQDEYGYNQCIKNKYTNKRIYISGTHKGRFTGDGLKLGERSANEIVQAYENYIKKPMNNLDVIKSIVGDNYEPTPDIDIKEVKKNLKRWTRT